MDLVHSTFHIDACYLVASALVAFYAVSRFNTPRTVRSETTRFQYFGSCATYVISCQGLLMLVAWLLAQKPAWLDFLHFGSTEPIPDTVKGLEAPLVGALVLTTLLPTFPVLRDFDAVMLRFFHRMGAIPIGAVRWAQRMNMAQFTIAGPLLSDTRNFITNSTLLPDSLLGEMQPEFSADGVRFRFTRSLALFVALTNLEGMAGFRDDFPEETAAFEKKMGSFFAQCVAFFALTGQLSQRQLEPVPDSIEKFRSYALDAYEEIRLMLARVLLYSCNGDAEVAEKLKDMGFSVARQTPVRLPLNLLSFDIVGVVLLFAGTTLISATQISATQLPLGKALAIGFFVALNHSIAAVCALLPKQIWSFADIRCARERPILSYVISGACALTIAMPVSYGFYLLRLHVLPLDSAADAIMPFPAQCKWLLLSTFMAVALAFACDDFAETDHDPAWLKWAEGAGLAILMALAGLLVISWLQPDLAALHPSAKPPSLWAPAFLSASIGALFGATIPRWYRQMMRLAESPPLARPFHDAPPVAAAV